MSELSKAFLDFAETSRQMELAYHALEKRVAKVDAELENTNVELARKVAELDHTTVYLNQLLESMHSGVVAVDRDGRITTFNRAASETLELDPKEVIGKHYDRVFTDGSVSGEGVLKALEPNARPIVEEREVSFDGTAKRIIESSITPTIDSRNCPIGAVEVFRDVTELHALQEKVHQADKLAALGQMAAMLAHEIRNPLNGIEGFASLLERDLGPTDDRRRFAENIIRGVRDLNRAVNDMLFYVQERPVQLETVPLYSIVERALDFVEQELRWRGQDRVRITFDEGEPALIDADVDQLQRGILNLLLNAVQAVDGNGVINVTIRKEKADSKRPIVLEIADSGCGISQNDQKKLFEPFFTTKANGTGLGLAVTRQIIERHKGSIGVTSEPRRGTSFFICLPEARGQRDSSKCQERQIQGSVQGMAQLQTELNT